MAVRHRLPRGWAALAPLLALLLAAPVAAEELKIVREDTREAGFAIDGFRIELGAALPQNADVAPLLGAALNVGTFGFPWIDATLGARWWSSDIDRSSFDNNNQEGTLGDLGIRAGLSTHLPAVRGARPYLTAGLAGHWISADIPGDRSLQDALEGVSLGADLGIGLASTRDGIGWRAEARRDFVEDAGHWGLVLGFGWWPKTRAERTDRDDDRPASTTTTTVVPVPVQRTAVATPAEPAPNAELLRELRQLRRQNERLAARLDSLARAREAAATTPPPAPVQVERSEPAPPPPPDLGETLRRMSQLGGDSQLRSEGDGYVLRLSGSALFSSGSAAVQPAAQEELRRLALVLLRHRGVRARVEGHSDAQGNDAFNLQLSQQRADAVAAELLAVGIEPSRVQAVGVGEDRPVASNDTAAGRAQNRRVEIHLSQPDTRGGNR